MECLKNIIGLTRSDCPCFEDQLDADAKVSTSGLYLDEINGGITLESIKSVADCGSSLIKTYQDARDQAELAWKSDLMAEMAAKMRLAKDPYLGLIGSRSFARTRILTTGMAGLRLRVKNIVGAYLTINSIHTYFEQTGSVSVNVIEAKQLPGESEWIYNVLATITLPTLANMEKASNLEAPIKLPLFSLDGGIVDYYFVYDRQGTYQPKDNNARCNCGGAEMRMLQYVTPIGIQGDNLADLSDWNTSSYTNGIGLNVDARCGSTDVLCDALMDEAFRMITGYALWYKAGELVIDKLLSSPEINLYTMSNREYLYGRRNHFKAEYYARIQWLAENINVSGTDCYECDDKKIMHKSGLLIT